MSSGKVIGRVQVNNESNQVIDPDTHVKIIDTDGVARIAHYGDLIYDGEQLYCDNEDVTLQVKYLALEDATVYEGVFRVLADGSVIAGLEGHENMFGDEIDFMDTAAGDAGASSSSAFLEETSSDALSELLAMDRGTDDTGFGSGITGFSVVSVDASDQTPPVITSTNTLVYDENDTQAVLQVTATDTSAIAFSIEDGLDAALFSIDPITGVVSFNDSPDFETPLDLGGDNEYNITVTVTDALGNFTTQLLSINVNNVNEAPVGVDDNIGFGEDAVYENGTVELDILANDTDVDADDNPSNFTLVSLDGEYNPALSINTQNNTLVFTAGEDFDYLADGESVELVVNYTMSDDGEPPLSDTATVTLKVTGTNDAPVITNGDDVVGLTETDAALLTSGEITVTDVDTTDIVTATVEGVVVSGTNDSDVTLPDNDALASMLTVSPATILDGSTTSAELTWNFNSDITTFDYLAAGETLVLTYTVQATDDDGTPLNDTTEVEITITGTNDKPVVSDVNANGNASADEQVSYDVNPALAITDNNTILSAISVTEIADISDLNVEVDIDHTWVGDLIIQLTSPNGTTVDLFYDASGFGASGDNFENTIFDDESAVSIADANAPYVGTFRPIGDLSDFDGENLNGTWILSVEDDQSWDEGVLDSWSLHFTTEGGQTVVYEVDSGLNTFNGDLVAVEDADTSDTHDYFLDTTTSVETVTQSGLTIQAPNVTVDIDGSYIVSGDFNQLADGEKATVTFNYYVVDSSVHQNNGESNTSDSATVTLVITGTNDAPILETVNVTGEVTEASSTANLTDTGDIVFGDVDLTDTHTVSISNPSAGALGALTATVTEGVDADNGTVTWTYTVADAAVQYLAENETKVETFDVTIDDGNGGTDTQTVTVTIKGTNDAPIIEDTSAISATAIEAGNADNGDVVDATVASGQMVSSDVDVLGQTATWSATGGETTDYGTFTITEAGLWTYTMDATPGSAADQLAEGHSHDETFEVTVRDDKGATDTQTITVTIEGTNDSPTVVNEDNVYRGEDAGWINLKVLNNDSDIDSNDTNKNMEISAFSTEFISTTSGLSENDFNLNNVLNYIDKNDNKLDKLKFRANKSFDKLATDEEVVLKVHYTVQDDQGATTDGYALVTVVGTNDAPKVKVDYAKDTENASFSVDVLANDIDVDHNDNSSNFSLDSVDNFMIKDSNGDWIALDANTMSTSITQDNKLDVDLGTHFDYLAQGEKAQVRIYYTMSDDEGLTQSNAKNYINLTIKGTNDAPIANLDGVTAIDVNTQGTSDALVYDSRIAGNEELFGGATSLEVALTIATTSNNSNALLSYASDDNSNGGNEFLLFSNDTGTSIQVFINGQSHSFALGASIYDGTPHTLSVDWDSVSGDTTLSIDGLSKGTFILAQGHTLGSNGVLMLGQEQDITGGGLAVSQIFSGEYFDFGVTKNGEVVAEYEMQTIENGVVTDSVGGFDLVAVADAGVTQHDARFITDEDTDLVIDASELLANDTDIDGDVLYISSVQDATNGTVSLSGTTITFIPNADYNGDASFTYTVDDGHGGTDTQIVHLTISPVNDAPVAVDDTYVGNFDAIAVNTTTDDGRLEFDSRGANAELLGGATSVDISVTIATTSTNSNSILSYASSEHNNDFLIFTNDSGTNIGIYIDGQVKNVSTASIYDGEPHTISVSWNSAEGTTVVSVDSIVKGTFTGHAVGHTIGEDGVLMLGQEQDTVGGGLDVNQIFSGEYHDLSIGVNGIEVAHYEMNSLNGGTVVDSVGSFDLSTVGDVSIATHESPLVTNEDTPLTIDAATLLSNDSDLDGDAISVSDVSNPTNGTVEIVNGEVVFTPNENYNGEASFTYTITDGALTDTATVTLNVVAVNDAPIAVDDKDIDGYLDVTPNHAHINLGSEADFDFTTAFTISQNVTHTGNGGIIFNKENSYEVAVYSDGSIKYALNEASGSNTWVWNDTGYDLESDVEHHISFVYDGSANTVTLFVDGVSVFSGNNNVPSALANTSSDLMFGERGSNGQPFEGQIDDIQIHSVALDATAVGLIVGGELVTSNLVASYDFNGETPLEDTSGNGHTATLVSGAEVITTTLADETPYTTNEDEPLTISKDLILSNDSDIDGDALTITNLTMDAAQGTVGFDTNGNIVYTPETDFNGAASFTYTVNDGTVDSAPATVTLNVTAVNDAPVVTDDNIDNLPEPVFEALGVQSFTKTSNGDEHSFTQTFDTQLTMSAWIQMDGNIDDYARVLEFGESAGTYHKDSSSLSFGSSGSKNTIRAWTNDEGPESGRTPEVNFDMSAYVNDGQMHLVTYTFDNSYAKLYVDGIEVDSAVITNSITSIDDPQTINIGGYDGGSQYSFEGDIDGVGVFNVSLSAQEVQSIYDAGSGTVTPDQILYVNDVDAGSIDLVTLIEMATQDKSLDKIELSGKTEIDINLADVIEVTDGDNELLIISTDDVNDTVHLDDNFNTTDAGGNTVLNIVSSDATTNTYEGSDGIDTVLITIENTIFVD